MRCLQSWCAWSHSRLQGKNYGVEPVHSSSSSCSVLFKISCARSRRRCKKASLISFISCCRRPSARCTRRLWTAVGRRPPHHPATRAADLDVASKLRCCSTSPPSPGSRTPRLPAPACALAARARWSVLLSSSLPAQATGVLSPSSHQGTYPLRRAFFAKGNYSGKVRVYRASIRYIDLL